MTQQDYQAFVHEYRRMSSALERYKQSPTEVDNKADAYFHVLKKYPLEAVIAKADTWLETESKFPKPAEWAGVIPRGARIEYRQMTAKEVAEYRRAEQLRYEDGPCTCSLCVHAGVSEKPIRFVPEFDAHDRDVKVMDGERTVTAGHWAHGTELARWYQTKADFYNAYYAALQKKTLAAR